MKTSRKEGVSVGDFILRNGKEFIVYFVSESRALICPLNARIDHEKDDDGKIKFLAEGEQDSISPGSEVELVQSLGRKGLAAWLDERETSKKENKMNDKATKKDKNKKKEDRSPGKLGGYKGFSMTSVFRAMGKFGWSLAEARAFCKEQKIDAADNTIKIQLRRGAKGEEEPANISKADLEKVRPDVPEEAPKKKDKDKKNGKSKDKSKKKDKDKKNGKKKDKSKKKDDEAGSDDDEGDDAGEKEEKGEEAAA